MNCLADTGSMVRAFRRPPEGNCRRRQERRRFPSIRCVYSVIGKNRVNESGEECFGMLYAAEIETFQGQLHSEMEQVLRLDQLPTRWTYPEIQPRLVEEYQRRERDGDTL